MARVIHFEIMATTPERTITFYKNVFGWKVEGDGDEKYWLATTGDGEKPGINGAFLQVVGDSSLVNIIEVLDIDETISKINENGCSVVIEKRRIPEVGTVAYFRDTEGLLVGIIQRLV